MDNKKTPTHYTKGQPVVVDQWYSDDKVRWLKMKYVVRNFISDGFTNQKMDDHILITGVTTINSEGTIRSFKRNYVMIGGGSVKSTTEEIDDDKERSSALLVH